MLTNGHLFSNRWRRVVFSLFIVTAVAVAASGIADRFGLRYLEGGMKRALVTLLGSAKSGFNLESRFQQYKKVAGELTTTSIELIVIFLFQTIVLPLAMLFFGRFAFTSTMRMLKGFRSSG